MAAQQHQADQKLAEKDREGDTLLLAMRSWEFAAFAALSRGHAGWFKIKSNKRPCDAGIAPKSCKTLALTQAEGALLLRTPKISP